MKTIKQQIFATTFWIVGACAATAQDFDQVLAKVGEVEITTGHVAATLAIMPPEYQQAPDDLLFETILEQLIQQEALIQSYEPKETPLMGLMLDNEKRIMQASAAVRGVIKEAVSEDDVKGAYDAQYASADMGVEFNASHILVKTLEEAQAVLETIEEDGSNFAEVAKEKSTGPSGPSGGNLGWFSDGMMVPTFQDAVNELAIGQISKPVETQFGWHLIVLNDKRNVAAPTFEEVAADLRRELESSAVAGAVEAALGKAAVERTDLGDFDPAVIRNIEALE